MLSAPAARLGLAGRLSPGPPGPCGLPRANALRQTERVPEFCTCGAQLPPDARFCHKCGKPQREEPIEEEREPQPPVAAPAPAPRSVPARIGFRNALAVRLGLLAALFANLFNLLLFLGCPLWLVSAGFLCVYLYQRRTGEPLSVRGGARIGWITGLFSFAIFALLTTFAIVAEIRSGEFFERLREVPFLKGNADQIINLLHDPVYLTLNLLFGLGVLFVVFTVFTVTGGALGAKVLGKEPPRV